MQTADRRHGGRRGGGGGGALSPSLLLLLAAWCAAQPCAALGKSYLNEFVAHVVGGSDAARRVADELGFHSVTKVEPFDDIYSFSHPTVPARSKRSGVHHERKLSDHPKVVWAEQQHAKVRAKRDDPEAAGFERARELEERAYDKVNTYSDPLLAEEWYLMDKTKDEALPKMDLHVVTVWQAGITGKNVSVSILDDGLEWTHSDIVANYDPFGSYDLNDNDSDPTPRYDPTNENQHGTRCAGVVAMGANNAKCGVGVAPDARIGGVRMLDGSVSDRVEAQALSFNYTHVDIYSASWGPSDNGRMVEGPGKLTAAALELGIGKGRNGKGVLYVWASGNGGFQGDSCACDGYASSPYTISISSASVRFKTPYYSEQCASTMATTFSSGEFGEREIVTTDLNDQCTKSFTGTSAAAPQAAGVLALVLERNPKLTWRDVQHLIAWTAEPYPLWGNKGWRTNGAGFRVNTRFGFGILNAATMVDLADPAKWISVPERQKCELALDQVDSDGGGEALPLTVEPRGATAKVELHVTGCAGQRNQVKYLEHIELVVNVTHSYRGCIAINLTSAQGTATELLRPRYHDDSDKGFQNWPFMSVHTWGENPAGTWTVTIRDDCPPHKGQGRVNGLKLVVYGTREAPDILTRSAGGRRAYDAAYIDVLRQRRIDNDEEKETFLSAPKSPFFGAFDN